MAEKTAEEIAREEMEEAIARGDFLEGEEPELGEIETEENTDDDSEEDQDDSNDEESGNEDDSDDGEADEKEDAGEEETDADTNEVDVDEEEESKEETEEDDEKEARIPKKRLDKVIQQREDAKEKVAWLEAQLEKALDKTDAPVEKSTVEPEVEEFDFDTAEEKYIELLLSGEAAQAAQLRKSINTEQSKVHAEQIAEATKVSKTEAQNVLNANKYEATVVDLEKQYPFLNHEHDDYNEEAVDTINTLMTGYEKQGDSQDVALLKAVKTMAPIYGKPEADAQADTIKTEKAANKTVREAKAKKTSVKASNQQPADIQASSKVNGGKKTVSIADLSEKEFAKLTERELAVLRGDVV